MGEASRLVIGRVQAWREALRNTTPRGTSLSPAGLAAAWEAALEALSDEALAAAAAIPGAPFQTACVLVAGTVPTAAIEWSAALLLRGTRVVIKHPTGDPGLTSHLVDAAVAQGLPLTATDDRAAVAAADLVVAMGSDATIREVRAAARPTARVLVHGHRFSIAWVTEEKGFHGVAEDAALHDGRGCLSPALVFTTVPDALDRLADAMKTLEARWPRGAVDPTEGAAMRTREALARATGAVRSGAAWSVHALPPKHAVPAALPRCVALVCFAEVSEAVAVTRAWGPHLSTVGTDDAPGAEAFVAIGASRICALGRMQRPPLVRSHDGEDWLRAIVRSISRER